MSTLKRVVMVVVAAIALYVGTVFVAAALSTKEGTAEEPEPSTQHPSTSVYAEPDETSPFHQSP